MWEYKKSLEYPINIKNPNPKLAKFIITQYGGPDGELGASLRYLSQRYEMPFDIAKATLTDIGTEELAHLEMVGAIVHQLTRNLSPSEVKAQGFGDYFVDHGLGVYPQSAAGTPYNAFSMAVKGDVIADLNEDLAAEQKARATYENILKLADDPDVIGPIKFLRAREIVHYQRFGETLRYVEEKLGEKNKFYMPKVESAASNMPNSNVANIATNMPKVAPIESTMKPNMAPIESAMKPNMAPIESAMKPNMAPIESAMKPNMAPIESAMKPNMAPIESAMKSKMAPMEKAVKTNARPVEMAPIESMKPLETPMGTNTAPINTTKPLEEPVESSMNKMNRMGISSKM